MPNDIPRQRVRVVFVDHTAQLGGGEIALRNLLRRIDSSRIDAHVLLGADGPLVEQLRKHHPVHVLSLNEGIGETRKDSIGWKYALKGHTLLSILNYTWRLSRFLRRAQAQVVHTNSLKAHLIGGLAGRLAGIPVVWHVRDRIATDYLPSAAIALVRLLSRILPRFIIANSHATLVTLLDPRSFRGETISKARFRVIHDGCELPMRSSSPNAPKPVAPRPVKVGLIARISPWKGQHIFIQAAAYIRERFPHVRFQIIGAPLFSETEYEAGLKRLTRDLGVEQQIEFSGFVHDIQSTIDELDIVVHASTIGEPFGQVVIEGMAAGKPVIATNGGGIPEIVVDQETGLLIAMNDARALADAMVSLLSDPERARAMGARGRLRVEESFTIERTAEAVEQVYSDLLSGERACADQARPMLQKRADQES